MDDTGNAWIICGNCGSMWVSNIAESEISRYGGLELVRCPLCQKDQHGPYEGEEE